MHLLRELIAKVDFVTIATFKTSFVAVRRTVFLQQLGNPGGQGSIRNKPVIHNVHQRVSTITQTKNMQLSVIYNGGNYRV